jgi:hypothetical protein
MYQNLLNLWLFLHFAPVHVTFLFLVGSRSPDRWRFWTGCSAFLRDDDIKRVLRVSVKKTSYDHIRSKFEQTRRLCHLFLTWQLFSMLTFPAAMFMRIFVMKKGLSRRTFCRVVDITSGFGRGDHCFRFKKPANWNVHTSKDTCQLGLSHAQLTRQPGFSHLTKSVTLTKFLVNKCDV